MIFLWNNAIFHVFGECQNDDVKDYGKERMIATLPIVDYDDAKDDGDDNRNAGNDRV